jgi:hypothetical protein
MKLFPLAPALGLGFLFWTGCSTEVELNAPYKSSTVVFGLLDPSADTQWVKINKTFLGKGNNLEFALIRDSSEYNFSEFNRLVIEEVVDGNVVNEFPLQEKTITNKELNGIFYAPVQTVYYFPTPEGGLNEDGVYRLICDFHNRPDVTAVTNVVKSGSVGFQIPQQGSAIILAQTSFGSTVNYSNNVTVKWSPAANAELYDVTLRFLYHEKKYTDATHTVLISEQDKFVDWNIGQFKPENLSLQGGYLSLSFNSEPFFSYLGSVIPADPAVTREIGYYDGIKTRCFEIFMALANDELRTYFEVNSPVTGVIQERPTYTNVSGGLGLLGSRSRTGVSQLSLVGNNSQNGNLIALMFGEYTSDLNFCDPNPNNGDYSCE